MTKHEIEKILSQTRRTVSMLDDCIISESNHLRSILSLFSIETKNTEICFIKSNLAKNAVIYDDEHTTIIWDITYWDYYKQFISSVLYSTETVPKNQLLALFLNILQMKYSHYPRLCKSIQDYIDDYIGMQNYPTFDDGTIFRVSKMLALYHEIAHIVFNSNTEHRDYCITEVRRILNRIISYSADDIYGIDINTIQQYIEMDGGIIEELMADYFAVKELIYVIDDLDINWLIKIILDAYFCVSDFNRIMGEIRLHWQLFFPMIISKQVTMPSVRPMNMLDESYMKNIIGFAVTAFLLFEHFQDNENILINWNETVNNYINRFSFCHDIIFELTYSPTIEQIIGKSHRFT